MINYIVDERRGVDPDMKVQVIAATSASNEVLAMLSKYPTTSANLIGGVLLQNPCPVQNESVSLEYFNSLVGGHRDLAEIDDERETRSLKKDEFGSRRRRLSGSPDCDGSQDKASKNALYDALRQARAYFSYEDYKVVYRCYKDWRYSFGKCYKDNYNWRQPLIDCACAVDITISYCQPEG